MQSCSIFGLVGLGPTSWYYHICFGGIHRLKSLGGYHELVGVLWERRGNGGVYFSCCVWLACQDSQMCVRMLCCVNWVDVTLFAREIGWKGDRILGEMECLPFLP